MPNMSNITIIGHIGRDPELTQTKAGSTLKTSVAVNVGYGENKTTNWFNVTMFGKRAESLAQILKKGGAVCVVGQFSYRTYVSQKTGQTGIDCSVIANDITLLGGKGEHEQTATDPQAQAEPPKPTVPAQKSLFNDDVPF